MRIRIAAILLTLTTALLWAQRPRWAISRLLSFASIADEGCVRCGVVRCSY